MTDFDPPAHIAAAARRWSRLALARIALQPDLDPADVIAESIAQALADVVPPQFLPPHDTDERLLRRGSLAPAGAVILAHALANAPRDISAANWLAAAAALGRPTTRAAALVTLARLHRRGVLRRIARGRYQRGEPASQIAT